MWFEKHNYTFKTIFAMIQVDRENDYQTHTFLIYNKDNKWRWFEHSFPGLKGIHEFNTEKELINCFKKIYIKNIKYECEDFLDSDIDKFAYYEYNKPNKNMSVQEFFDFILI